MKDTPENTLRVFCTQFPLETYVKGDTVMQSGTKEDYFFFVETGAIKMMTTSAQGQNVVLHVFYPDSCFSLLTLINEGINNYDFKVMIPTQLRKIPREELLSFLHQHSDVLFDFNLRLLHGLQGLLNRIEQSVFVSAYQQVAGLLLYFLRHFSDENNSLILHITHQEIADWLGLSRENVSIQMKQLERDGVIRTQNKLLEIINLQQLQKLANPYASV